MVVGQRQRGRARNTEGEGRTVEQFHTIGAPPVHEAKNGDHNDGAGDEHAQVYEPEQALIQRLARHDHVASPDELHHEGEAE